ncbi:MAG TPA: hypothetical protein PLS39_14630, partial [Accumulibacter sp.]|nr:hypothetical protein [Accumulibacter sp.]
DRPTGTCLAVAFDDILSDIAAKNCKNVTKTAWFGKPAGRWIPPEQKNGKAFLGLAVLHRLN